MINRKLFILLHSQKIGINMSRAFRKGKTVRLGRQGERDLTGDAGSVSVDRDRSDFRIKSRYLRLGGHFLRDEPVCEE